MAIYLSAPSTSHLPRNINPAVGEIDHVLLYQIDDLKEVVNSNIRLREQAINDVHGIIKKKLSEYDAKIQKLPASQVIEPAI